MKKYGEIFRKLRKSKKASLSFTSQHIVSPQFLSRFERNESRITLDIFLQLLDRLNIHFNEFMMHMSTSNNLTNQHDFLKEYGVAYTNKDIDLLNHLLLEEKKNLIYDENERHKHNIILIKQQICFINDMSFNSDDTQSIVKYLFDIDNWGFYELSLFNNSLFFFDMLQAESLSKIAIKKSSTYQTLVKNKHILAIFLMNVITLMLKNNQCSLVWNLISEVDNVLKNQINLYEKNRLNYLKGVYAIKTGDYNHGIELCKESIAILEHFNLGTLAIAYYDDFNILLKTQSTNN